jgi:hypothetical protein
VSFVPKLRNPPSLFFETRKMAPVDDDDDDDDAPSTI